MYILKTRESAKQGQQAAIERQDSKRGFLIMIVKRYISNGKLGLFLNLLSDPAVIVDKKGHIQAVNDAVEKATGISRKEMVGKSFLTLNIFTAESKVIFLDNLQKILQGISVEPYEIGFAGKTGETRYVEVKGKNVRYSGQPAYLVVFHDVTLRKETSKQLKEYSDRMETLVQAKVKDIQDSEENLRALINSMDDFVFVFNLDGTFKNYYQPSRTGAFYTPPQEFIGKHFHEVLPPNVTELLQDAMKKIESSGEVQEFDYSMEFKGVKSWYNSKLSPMKDHSGHTISITSVVRNITERKKTEEELTRLSNAINTSSDSIIISGLDGKIIEVNEVTLKMYGTDDKMELIGKSAVDLIAPEEQKKVLLGMKEMMEKGFLKNQEYTAVTKNGSRIPVDMSSVITKDANGKATGFVSISRDITERKQSEEEIRRAEEKFRTIFEGSTEGIVAADAKTQKFIFVNPRICEITGYSLKELLKLSLPDLNREKDLPNAIEQFTKSLQGKIPIASDIPILRKDKKVVYCDISSKLMRIGGQDLLVGFFRDITERKLMEQEVHDNEEKFRAISNSVRDAIILIDEEGRIKFWNPAAEKTFGYTREESLEQNVHKLLIPTSMSAEEKRVIKRGFEQFANTGTGVFVSGNVELIGRRKDGSEFPVNLSLSPLKLGTKWHAVGVARDITEQKQNEQITQEYAEKLEKAVATRTNELKVANDSLLKLERLAAIGELAGMIGHDLRNPLTGIKNATYLLKKKGAAISEIEAKAMLEIIEREIGHSDKIIDDLLEYAKEMRLELHRCPLRNLIIEAITLIKVPEKVKIINNIPDELKIKIDPNKIERVFINLVKNAIDAMPNGGTITINCQQKNSNFEISFSDTGKGIPEEIQSKLFTPLFTTKAQGMGFGLAICKRIIEAHEGAIKVETETGKGTTFTVILPIEPKYGFGGEKI
jgi:PAS domain S-box-containing protein